jgi:prophage tail gpP-like protein
MLVRVSAGLHVLQELFRFCLFCLFCEGRFGAERDRAIMERQQQGLRYDPPLTLIDDADTQAKWYYRLKREYRRARAEGRPFQNPVEPRTLEWRS